MSEERNMNEFADFMKIIVNSLSDKRFAVMIFAFFNLTLSFIILCISLPVGASILGCFGVADVLMIWMSHDL